MRVIYLGNMYYNVEAVFLCLIKTKKHSCWGILLAIEAKVINHIYIARGLIGSVQT